MRPILDTNDCYLIKNKYLLYGGTRVGATLLADRLIITAADGSTLHEIRMDDIVDIHQVITSSVLSIKTAGSAVNLAFGAPKSTDAFDAFTDPVAGDPIDRDTDAVVLWKQKLQELCASGPTTTISNAEIAQVIAHRSKLEAAHLDTTSLSKTAAMRVFWQVAIYMSLIVIVVLILFIVSP